MNSIQKILNTKKTENGDIAYNSTGNNLLDILFLSNYFEKHIDEVSIGKSDKEKLFSMFVRDPRYGLGRRDLGRRLMSLSEVDPEDIVLAGRFDDLIYSARDKDIEFFKEEIAKDNELAKKWAPRLTGKNSKIAKALCKIWNMSEKQYRKYIKCNSTVEYKLSYAEQTEKNALEKAFNANKVTHPLVEEIDFEKIPSLAMIKYFQAFRRRQDTKERFEEYLSKVKSGEKKLNITTTNVYDIYKNRDNIDADLFFDKLEKINISCIPVVDTSGSMSFYTANDAYGKAVSIGHYLAKCSSFCNNYVVSFSSNPRLMEIKGENYKEEIASLYTGDCTNTNLGKVMDLFADLEDVPDYLVILSDMEFDAGSSMRKDDVMKLWKEKGYKTKIVWWNFNSRNKTVPEVDDMGNIFISGYSPSLLKYLEVGFDGEQYLDNLLSEYANKLSK